MNDEIEAERAAAAAADARLPAPPAMAAQAVGAVMRHHQPPNFMTMNLSENVSPSRLELIKQLRRRGIFARQMDITPEMRTKLLGRNTLTRKLLLKLGIDDSVFQTRKKALQIADSIDRRVDRTKVQEVVLLPISWDELHDYLRIGRGKRDRGEPLVTLLPQFPRISFLTSGRKNVNYNNNFLTI